MTFLDLSNNYGTSCSLRQWSKEGDSRGSELGIAQYGRRLRMLVLFTPCTLEGSPATPALFPASLHDLYSTAYRSCPSSQRTCICGVLGATSSFHRMFVCPIPGNNEHPNLVRTKGMRHTRGGRIPPLSHTLGNRELARARLPAM
jgi:hypothetical protein